MKIEILQLVEGAKKARGLTVIIDVFRAFTVESLIMGRGAAKLIPVGDVDTALQYRKTHPDALLCGERGGAIIDGFDFGNSPSQVETVDFSGKTLVHTTSAGTQGIVNATGAEEILGGCLLSAKAIACYIKKKNPEHVSLVCMGLAGLTPTDEDTLCAEYIKSLLEDRPLPDLRERIAGLARTDGAKFFDPAQQSVFPEADFHIAVKADICPFVLRLGRDPESGLPVMERVDVPEAFSLPRGATLGGLSRAEAIFFPDTLKAAVVYGQHRQPEGKFDAALVLGGATFLMPSRAKAAAELYHAGQCELFITTGGVVRESAFGKLTEAEILKRHMMALGVPEEKILTENKATTTRENYQYCREILSESFTFGEGRRVMTVTSRGHLTRSLALANAYIPEHSHFGCPAVFANDTPEGCQNDPEFRRRLMKEFLALRAYVEWKLIPDLPIG